MTWWQTLMLIVGGWLVIFGAALTLCVAAKRGDEAQEKLQADDENRDAA